jgi:hypothetical protein
MRKGWCTASRRRYILLILFLAILIPSVLALTSTGVAPEPVAYLNFNEDSGGYAFDLSGHGNTGTLHNTSRIASGCGKAVFLNGIDSYVSIPFSSANHPVSGITVSAWFYTDTFEPATLISTYDNGGYRLGFDDGNDLWWTVNVGGVDVSVPVQHEGISLHQWHQVTGTFDGTTSKIYLDGILRNQANASGSIHYQNDNSVLLGADAGADAAPADCSRYFNGGLDELRIYDTALSYGQVMDDRFSCPTELSPPPGAMISLKPQASVCSPTSGALQLGEGDSADRTITFANATETASWTVSLSPGSTLVVQAEAAYAKAYPNAWFVGITDERGTVDRVVAFPNTNNAPAQGVIPSGNATVTVRYFDGPQRFPAHVTLEFESIAPPHIPIIAPVIPINPIIVIYSASWATFIALVFVGIWIHRRQKETKEKKDN